MARAGGKAGGSPRSKRAGPEWEATRDLLHPQFPGVGPARELGPDRLSVTSKLCYAIGGAPNQVALSATSFFLQIYLLDIAQITAFHTSLVLFVGKAWGAAADPVGGFFISKSKQTRIGHLMPWILGCTPFMMISYFFLWYLPPFTAGKVVWYLTFNSLFQALSTLYHVPYTALTMFLSTNQHERDSATAYRMTFEVLGTLVGAALQGQLVASAHYSEHCTNHTVDILDQDSLHLHNSSLLVIAHGRKVYMTAAGIIGGLYFVGIVALFLGVKEKVDLYTVKSNTSVPFFMGLRLTIRYGRYVKLTAAFLMISTAVQIEQGNFVLFCIHATDLQSHFQYLVVIILWMIPFTILLVTVPKPGIAYVVAFVSGLSIAAALLLPWSMLPDVVDHFREENPRTAGHETIFYSSYIFFTKISAGIGLGFSSASLQVSGYKSAVCKQVSSVITMLKLLIGAVPAVLIIMGLLILFFYPTGEESEMKYNSKNRRRNRSNTQNLSEKEENTWL
ncbi:sphingosine-1-phosphate transporter MFSD2B isoform X2 [Tiliqua scincoides]|uniref:sphingosine-1-phosphate transporter MFSD2B isoform X2 n=1 Tax=Tiliqua scincoides TaxID=71010 RepID=UPI0034630E44